MPVKKILSTQPVTPVLSDGLPVVSCKEIREVFFALMQTLGWEIPALSTLLKQEVSRETCYLLPTFMLSVPRL